MPRRDFGLALRISASLVLVLAVSSITACKQRHAASETDSILLADRYSQKFWRLLSQGEIGVCFKSEVSPAVTAKSMTLIQSEWAKWQSALNRYRTTPLAITPTRKECGSDTITVIYTADYKGAHYTGHAAVVDELTWVINPRTDYIGWAPSYLHELGHFVGLNHTHGTKPEFASIMSYDTIKKVYWPSRSDVDLLPDDLNGAIQAMRLYQPDSFVDHGKYKIIEPSNSYTAGLVLSQQYFGPGLLVDAVTPGGPAERARINPGDILFTGNGQPFDTFDELIRIKNASGGTLVVEGMVPTYKALSGKSTIVLAEQGMSLLDEAGGSASEKELGDGEVSQTRNIALVVKRGEICDQSLWTEDGVEDAP